MDFNLVLSYQEQNDNKAIILTDASNWDQSGVNFSTGSLVIGTMYEVVTDGGNSTYSTSGSTSDGIGSRFVATAATAMGAGDVAKEVTSKISEITSATLDTDVTDTSLVVDSKTKINLYTEFSGPWSVSGQLVFTITALLFGDTADSELIDGLYDIKYNIGYTPIHQTGGTEQDATELDVIILVYGQVKVLVYEKLRQIPVLYMCKDCASIDEYHEADLCAAYLSSIETSAYVAKTEELLSMLATLENIIVNGSNITW